MLLIAYNMMLLSGLSSFCRDTGIANKNLLVVLEKPKPVNHISRKGVSWYFGDEQTIALNWIL